MPTANAHQNRPGNVQLLPMFLHWYMAQRPGEIVRLYKEYARAFRELFSFTFLLRTLFAPWKSIKDSYPSKGFNMEAILQTFFLNITARAIGCVIRIFAIIAGIALQIGLLAGFGIYLTVWILFPLLIPAVILLLILR